MLKRYVVMLAIFLMCCCAGAAWGNSLNYQWTTVFGSPTGRVQAKAIQTDSSGNVYVAGNFVSEFAGVTSQGGSDIFVRKYSAAGNVMWTKIIGGVYEDVPYDLAVGPANEVVVVGLFGGEVDFDPSSSERVESADSKINAFILSLSEDGLLRWIHAVKQVVISQVSFDSGGNIFYCGAFQNRNPDRYTSLEARGDDLDPTSGEDIKISYNLKPIKVDNRWHRNLLPDTFLSKLSSDGNTYYWTQVFGETGKGFIPTAMSVDGSAAYISGFTSNDTAFLLKANAASYADTAIWQHENTFPSIATDIDIDGSGNIYQSCMAGPFLSIMEKLGYRDTPFPSPPESIGVVTKYSPTGDTVWQWEFENSELMSPFSIAADASGHAYVTGAYKGYSSFDAENGFYSRGGSEDVFLLRLDKNGEFDWVKTLGGYGNDSGERLFMEGTNLYLAGQFRSGFDFDWTDGLDYQSAVSHLQNGFLTKIGVIDPTTGGIAGKVGGNINNTTLLIGNATVVLEGTAHQTTSTATGAFSFSDIEPGTYTVTASADNFGSVSKQATIAAGDTSEIGTMELALMCSLDTGGISGQVMSTAGNANLLVGGATVTLEDSSGSVSFTEKAAADGVFSFTNIPEGTYTLRIEADNFQTITKIVSVQPGENLTLPTSETQVGIECGDGVPGDANRDGKISLEDVVYNLQVITAIK